MQTPPTQPPCKALTLTQPWASLVAIGAKHIETRSWHTDYRGPLAIHAAKGMPTAAIDFALFNPACRALMERHDFWQPGDGKALRLPRGAVVATATLTACIETTNPLWRKAALGGAPDEEAFGDYSPGRFMWFLTDVIALPEPIPARGSLGLWDWSGGAA